VAALEDACAEAGRDPATIRRLALVGLELAWPQSSPEAWADFRGRIGDLGFTDVAVHWPRPHERDLPGPSPQVFDAISPEDCL
jgi:hypothetical protein